MLTWLFILLTVLLGSCGDVLCAKGMASGGDVTQVHPSSWFRLVRSIVTRKWILLGVACDAVSFFSLLGLLSVTQLSVAAPATALSFVIDTLGARFVLHERVRWRRWLGILFVTVGVLLTMQSVPGKSSGSRPGATPSTMQADHH